VAEEIARETPKLSTFVTLSPAPNFADWLKRERANPQSRVLSKDDRVALANLDTPGWHQTEKTRDPVREPLIRAAAWYYLHARSRSGSPVDEARFRKPSGTHCARRKVIGRLDCTTCVALFAYANDGVCYCSNGSC
jgi:malonyl-CoA decarboxylase